MKQKYEMFKGPKGNVKSLGTYETEDIADMDHKIFSGEIDYYSLVDN